MIPIYRALHIGALSTGSLYQEPYKQKHYIFHIQGSVYRPPIGLELYMEPLYRGDLYIEPLIHRGPRAIYRALYKTPFIGTLNQGPYIYGPYIQAQCIGPLYIEPYIGTIYSGPYMYRAPWPLHIGPPYIGFYIYIYIQRALYSVSIYRPHIYTCAPIQRGSYMQETIYIQSRYIQASIYKPSIYIGPHILGLYVGPLYIEILVI